MSHYLELKVEKFENYPTLMFVVRGSFVDACNNEGSIKLILISVKIFQTCNRCSNKVSDFSSVLENKVRNPIWKIENGCLFLCVKVEDLNFVVYSAPRKNNVCTSFQQVLAIK